MCLYVCASVSLCACVCVCGGGGGGGFSWSDAHHRQRFGVLVIKQLKIHAAGTCGSWKWGKARRRQAALVVFVWGVFWGGGGGGAVSPGLRCNIIAVALLGSNIQSLMRQVRVGEVRRRQAALVKFVGKEGGRGGWGVPSGLMCTLSSALVYCDQTAETA